MKFSTVIGLVSVTASCAQSVGTGKSSTGTSTCGSAAPPTTSASAATIDAADPTIGRFTTYDQPLYVSCSPPPPVSGGTLAVLSGHRAAVSDPDHDQILIVDLDAPRISAIVPLQSGDEPGRIVEGAAGRVHVVLRGGFLLMLDPRAGIVLERHPICSQPRGVAYDAARGLLHVACAGGELISLPEVGGPTTRELRLDSDLRDVVVDGDRLLVSRFRAAEVLVVEADGRVSGRFAPPPVTIMEPVTPVPPVPAGVGDPTMPATFSPAVAWRMLAAPGGGALMVFQEEQSSDVKPEAGGYGGACGGIVRSSVAMIRADGTMGLHFNVGVPLAVDMALAPNGKIDVITASTSGSSVAPFPRSVTVETPAIGSTSGDIDSCSVGGNLRSEDGSSSSDPARAMPEGQVLAVAYDDRGRRILQTREPYTLLIGDRGLVLPGESLKDTGHELFHFATPASVACASCHPEGREDGHVWTFDGLGPRRTQSIAGGILGTEPFHWSGDMQDFRMLTHEVLAKRMLGPTLRDDQAQVLADWIDQIPAPKGFPGLDPDAVRRGQAIFSDSAVRCATCHAGAKLTNNQTVSVGTGAPLQVPSLIGVAWRAPYLHNGCAPTLEDRFGDCGGGEEHGHTAALWPYQRADLIAYLKSL